jgi:hypothetical protein
MTAYLSRSMLWIDKQKKKSFVWWQHFHFYLAMQLTNSIEDSFSWKITVPQLVNKIACLTWNRKFQRERDAWTCP